MKSVQRERCQTTEVPNVPQSYVHSCAACRNPACYSPSPATGLLICQGAAAQAAAGLQASQQELRNFMCFSFLATNKPSNNRNQSVNLRFSNCFYETELMSLLKSGRIIY